MSFRRRSSFFDRVVGIVAGRGRGRAGRGRRRGRRRRAPRARGPRPRRRRRRDGRGAGMLQGVGDGLLADAGKPLADLSLAQQLEHFLFDQARAQQTFVQAQEGGIVVVRALEGNASGGGRHKGRRLIGPTQWAAK